MNTRNIHQNRRASCTDDLPIKGARVHGALGIVVLFLFVFTLPLVAQSDWPQWRGPDRDGRSTDTGLLERWPEGGPPLAWQAEGLGGGYSSLSVVGSRIFTMGDFMAPASEDGEASSPAASTDDAQFGQFVVAVSRRDGSPIWRTRVGPAWENRYLGPRSTPTFDDGRVYALSTEGHLVCLDAETGALVWSRSLPDDFGGAMMKSSGGNDWRFSESPLVDGDRVIVTPGVGAAALVALDKRSGTELWRTKMPSLGEAGSDGAGYSSVVVSHAAGVHQYVQLLGRGVIGVDAKTGRFLWGYNRVANGVANIATPLIDGNHVFVSTGYNTGTALLEIGKNEGGLEAREVYWLPPETLQNHHGGLILDHGTVYTGTGHNKGFPIAVKLADGSVAWGPERNEGQNSAAITYADGRLYFRYQNGTVILVEAEAGSYRERGSFELPAIEQFSWAHPVVAGGHLYLREQDRLYVYDLQKAGSSDAEPAR